MLAYNGVVLTHLHFLRLGPRILLGNIVVACVCSTDHFNKDCARFRHIRLSRDIPSSSLSFSRTLASVDCESSLFHSDQFCVQPGRQPRYPPVPVGRNIYLPKFHGLLQRKIGDIHEVERV